jgi:hypothetical protein
MLLAFSLDNPFPPAAVNPSLVPGELFECCGMFLPEFFVRGGRFVQHATQFRHLLLESYRVLVSCQQKTVALSRIVGKVRVASHREGRRPSSGRREWHPFVTWDDASRRIVPDERREFQQIR